MKAEISPKTGIMVAAVAVVICLSIAWFAKLGGNGEIPNPNAGKPADKSKFRGITRQAADSMTEDQYMEFLKRNRPDLSEAELKERADKWWALRSAH